MWSVLATGLETGVATGMLAVLGARAMTSGGYCTYCGHDRHSKDCNKERCNKERCCKTAVVHRVV